MNYPQEIDYHIELSSLKHFVNKLIENKVMPIDAQHIFSVLKQAVINSEVAPFLRKPITQEKEGYYEKYLRLEEENNSNNVVPDFFSYEGDFYDLDKNLNFSRAYVNDEQFQVLFGLKLIELYSLKTNIKEFLDFQLCDNYYGNKEEYGYFLYRLTSKDSISYLLPSINDKIQQWIKVNNINLALIDKEDVVEIDSVENTSNLIEDHWEAKKSKKIDGKMSIDEIKHFFSFLYKEQFEKSSNNQFKPILTKDEVDMIFSNGLVIPAKPLEKKVKLCIPPRFPKKIIDFAIYKFFDLNSYSHRDKKDYILFFANYIVNYENALNSIIALESLAKNITGESSKKNNINLDAYIPNSIV
jgi:hypothetical protein